MRVLIVGGSGATGKKLVEQLIVMGHSAKVIVRPTSSIPLSRDSKDQVTVIKGHVHELSVKEMAAHIEDWDAVASCLGHNLSLKGMYGEPRKLVTDTVKLVCSAVESNAPAKPYKFVLMNTAGNSNRDLHEPISGGQKIVIGLLRLLVPPHPDNEEASDYLRVQVGQDSRFIEWVTVRPDSLIDEEKVTEYELHPSPVRSAIFNPGKTSRINVGNFMAKLISDNELWSNWKGKMPVIYNKVRL